MFFLSKEAKQKKVLLQQLKLYNELEALRNVEKLPEPELEELRLEKLTIEQEKLSLSYDQLKQVYPKFTSISSEKDEWKIDKPKLSEGTLFVAEWYGQSFKCVQDYTIDKDVYEMGKRIIQRAQVERIRQCGYEDSILAKALDKITLEKRCNDALKLLKLEPPETMSLGTLTYLTYLLFCCDHRNIVTINNYHHTFGAKLFDYPEVLEKIAELTHTNIIIERPIT